MVTTGAALASPRDRALTGPYPASARQVAINAARLRDGVAELVKLARVTEREASMVGSAFYDATEPDLSDGLTGLLDASEAYCRAAYRAKAAA